MDSVNWQDRKDNIDKKWELFKNKLQARIDQHDLTKRRHETSISIKINQRPITKASSRNLERSTEPGNDTCRREMEKST